MEKPSTNHKKLKRKQISERLERNRKFAILVTRPIYLVFFSKPPFSLQNVKEAVLPPPSFLQLKSGNNDSLNPNTIKLSLAHLLGKWQMSNLVQLLHTLWNIGHFLTSYFFRKNQHNLLCIYIYAGAVPLNHFDTQLPRKQKNN